MTWIMSDMSNAGRELNPIFPTTQWTLLLDPVRRGGIEGSDALEKLCRRYWNPLFNYVRFKGYDHHQAQEIVQDFVVLLLQRGAFARLERQDGRFRSFLLVCLRNFLATRHERRSAQKRGGGLEPCSLDELGESAVPASGEDVAAFDLAWAREVYASALRRTEAEYQAAGRGDGFVELKAFITGEQPVPERAALAARRGVEVGAIDVGIHRLRRRFGVLLRAEVAQTVGDNGDVDAELEYLITLLSG